MGLIGSVPRRCVARLRPPRQRATGWKRWWLVLSGFAAIAWLIPVAFAQSDPDPALQLKAARDAFDAGHFEDALQMTDGLGRALPELADYVAWLRASAQHELENSEGVIKAVAPIWSQSVPSPLGARATMMAADAYMELEEPAAAVNLLRQNYSGLRQPAADLALADAMYAVGDKMNAAVYYQRIYYGYPTSEEAKRAADQIAVLEEELGADYPPAMGHDMLRRAEKLLHGGEPKKARLEYEALLDQLGGADRDLAHVRVGVARYMANENAAAYQYLSQIKVDDPQADAERMDYLSQASRRLKRYTEMREIVDQMAEKYPNSPWTADAALAAGNHFLLDNDVAAYEPLYELCFEAMPGSDRTDICHWKVTWAHYMRRDGDAYDWLRQHLEMYPRSGQSSAVLYFLGRIAQQAGDKPAAVAYFREASAEYPNQYYATISRERLKELRGIAPSDAVEAFLGSIAFPQRAYARDFQIQPQTKARLARAKRLAGAGLNDWAEAELRFGADGGEQPHVLAMELSRLVAAERPDQAIRYIKRHAAGYLFLPIASAPHEFWEMTFPLPYRNILMKHADTRQVDPFLVAGLVRQESEFNAAAVSRSGAYGLAQIMPSTGRDLAGRLKVSYSKAKLKDPEFNLQLGVYYMGVLLNATDGHPEVALAGYNAGLTRARAWQKWGDFREPAEYIETIPFTETRNYVQAVLRNAATYHEIYDSAPVQDQVAAQ